MENLTGVTQKSVLQWEIFSSPVTQEQHNTFYSFAFRINQEHFRPKQFSKLTWYTNAKRVGGLFKKKKKNGTWFQL